MPSSAQLSYNAGRLLVVHILPFGPDLLQSLEEYAERYRMKQPTMNKRQQGPRAVQLAHISARWVGCYGTLSRWRAGRVDHVRLMEGCELM